MGPEKAFISFPIQTRRIDMRKGRDKMIRVDKHTLVQVDDISMIKAEFRWVVVTMRSGQRLETEYDNETAARRAVDRIQKLVKPKPI